MGVEREHQLGDAIQVRVEPAQRALGVLDRARDEEAGAGGAEGHLHVDAEDGDADAVLTSGADAVGLGVAAGLLGNLRGALQVELPGASILMKAGNGQCHDVLRANFQVEVLPPS